ncbi:lipase [Schizosaccharomyces octosporus yFS286]|uniref:Lipase n=1 Tax=Schizosaccharomyces octosporus (strain yFS286) TaxID=483514 RepID=S9PZX0_SCHOY|nr:lipase [Schizosaccharomyces octosporus yFS286]EPX73013.1 lipase [Schizosaccharomyces octosporus yFS286]
MNIYVQRDDVTLAEIHRFLVYIETNDTVEHSPGEENAKNGNLQPTSSSLLGLRSGTSDPDSNKKPDKENKPSISSSVHSSLKSSSLAPERYSALPSTAHQLSSGSEDGNRTTQPSDLSPSKIATNTKSMQQSTPISENEIPYSVRSSSTTDHTVPLSRSPASVIWVQPSSSFWVCIPYACYSNKNPIHIEVASQAIFRDCRVSFELAIASTQQSIRAMSAADVDTLHAFPSLHIEHTSPSGLWKIPPVSFHAEKSHLVVLTHGMHSNIGADMEYLKEQIIKAAEEKGELVVVRGYRGNYCQTEKGIRWLGKRLAEWLLEILGWGTNSFPRYSHISFIGHSLGGLVQTYAAGYVHAKTKGRFFQAVHPVHFVTLATPWLGVAAEHPFYVGKALSYGIIGRTGQDLALMSGAHPIERRPFLVVMSDPASPFHQALSLFEHRTLFANTTNDYIVPYGTSAMKPNSLGQLDEAIENRKNTLSGWSHDHLDIPSANKPAGAMQYPNTTSEGHHHSGDIPASEDSSKTKSSSFSNAFKALAGLFSTPSSQHSLPNDAANELSAVQNSKSSKVENKPAEDTNDLTPAYSYPTKKSKSTSTLSGIANRLINTVTNLLIPAVPSSLYFLKFKSLNAIVSDETCEAMSVDSPDIDPCLTNDCNPSKMAENFLHNEKIISSNWHRQPWRKVSVHLDGDAHNSLFVRRRFPNAYGWTSVGHLMDILFQKNNLETYSDSIQFDELTTAAWLPEIYEEHEII